LHFGDSATMPNRLRLEIFGCVIVDKKAIHRYSSCVAPNYTVPDCNCVDVCIAAIGVAGGFTEQ